MALWSAVVLSARQTTENSSHPLDAIYIPTPSEVVTAMLQMANVGKNDIVFDLGSGDGRIVIAAAKHYLFLAGLLELDHADFDVEFVNASQSGLISSTS